jgi:hypothetical protein
MIAGAEFWALAYQFIIAFHARSEFTVTEGAGEGIRWIGVKSFATYDYLCLVVIRWTRYGLSC